MIIKYLQEDFEFQHMVSGRCLLFYPTPLPPDQEAAHEVAPSARPPSVSEDLLVPWIKCILIEDCINPIGAQSSGNQIQIKAIYLTPGLYFHRTWKPIHANVEKAAHKFLEIFASNFSFLTLMPQFFICFFLFSFHFSLHFPTFFRITSTNKFPNLLREGDDSGLYSPLPVIYFRRSILMTPSAPSQTI